MGALLRRPIGEDIQVTIVGERDQAFAGQHPGIRLAAYVMTEVEDTGSGMDAETFVRVFEPFSARRKQAERWTARSDGEQRFGCFPRVGDAVAPVEEARLQEKCTQRVWKRSEGGIAFRR